MQSYHRVLEILSIIQTIAPISYNEDGTLKSTNFARKVT